MRTSGCQRRVLAPGPRGLLQGAMTRAARNVLMIKLGFLALFAAACAGMWWHHLAVVRPRAECLSKPGAEWLPGSRVCRIPQSYLCEKNGGWWEPTSKVCAKVLRIPDITGRP